MKKTAKNPWKGILLLFITALFVLSLIWALSLLPRLHTQTERPVVAEIYQDGELLYSIDLSRITESYTLELTGEKGLTNSIAVEPGRIGMREANCPDKLCVKQGFYSAPSLPITCLPGQVVIQLHYADTAHAIGDSAIPSNSADIITPDIITY